MITRAKTNISAVKSFEQAVQTIKEYSPKFEGGIGCIEGLYKQLIRFANMLQENVEKMTSAQETLAVKIKNIEKIIAELTSKLNRLEEKLSELERQLADTPSTITIVVSEDECVEKSNPAYAAMEAEISALEIEISEVRSELHQQQARLEAAASVRGKLSLHMKVVNEVIYSLEEKKNTCKQLEIELENNQSQNLIQGTTAADALNRIEKIISEYLEIKMVYEKAITAEPISDNMQNGVNNNFDFSKNTNNREKTMLRQPNAKTIDFSEDIKAHNIKFNEAGRITSYNGKAFGGEYNSYEARLTKTPADNNLKFGQYEGIRGESKFIPSNWTEDGTVVIKILSQFGLDGICYRNAEPDFEPCSDAVVKITGMTENRDNFIDSSGKYALGNFSQADIELAKKWNLDKKDGRSDWKPRDVFNYRQANDLTWHEKCDTETMVLVHQKINLFFKHSGGVSECRVRDASGTDRGGFDE